MTSFQVFQDNSLHYHVTDIVHGTVGSIAPVISTDIMMFFCRFISFPMEGQFAPAVCTVEQAGEHGHFPHPGRPPFPGPDFLDDLKRFLVNDGLMGIFKDLPLIGSMLDFLMALVRLVVRLKVYRSPR